MESYEDNPATNILAAGVTEEKLNAAIIKSGYPLQTKVALLLQDTFRCHNECCVKVRSKKIWKPGLVNLMCKFFKLLYTFHVQCTLVF